MSSAPSRRPLSAEGYTVTRIEGIDRYKTNAEVLKAAGTPTATPVSSPRATTSRTLSPARRSAYKGSPLGLAKVDDIDDDVKTALVDSGIKKVVILGGPTIVGPEVEAELKAAASPSSVSSVLTAPRPPWSSPTTRSRTSA